MSIKYLFLYVIISRVNITPTSILNAEIWSK